MPRPGWTTETSPRLHPAPRTPLFRILARLQCDVIMKPLLPFALLGLSVGCTGSLPRSQPNKGTVRVVLASDVAWQQLNPARPASPKAGTLWGDRNGREPTGFLLRPTDGFRSPPHIHNVSYRGVMIRGLIHNDDPSAPELWMPAGSYWTQPKGDVHITAAKGPERLAYIEIEEGPYRVLPVEQAFDDGVKPVNTLASEIPWTETSGAVEMAALWGEPDGLNGRLLRFPSGFSGTLRGGSNLRAVVIQGRPRHHVPGRTEVTTLELGSGIESTGPVNHHLECPEETVLYVRSSGAPRIVE